MRVEVLKRYLILGFLTTLVFLWSLSITDKAGELSKMVVAQKPPSPHRRQVCRQALRLDGHSSHGP
ncbi:hypothetical protein AAG906_014102 [Vitis piasezkii]